MLTLRLARSSLCTDPYLHKNWSAHKLTHTHTHTHTSAHVTTCAYTEQKYMHALVPCNNRMYLCLQCADTRTQTVNKQCLGNNHRALTHLYILINEKCIFYWNTFPGQRLERLVRMGKHVQCWMKETKDMIVSMSGKTSVTHHRRDNKKH